MARKSASFGRKNRSATGRPIWWDLGLAAAHSGCAGGPERPETGARPPAGQLSARKRGGFNQVDPTRGY